MSDETESSRTDLDPVLVEYFARLGVEAFAGPPVEPSAAVSEFVTRSAGFSGAAPDFDGTAPDIDGDMALIQPFAAPENPRRRWPVALAAAVIAIVVAGGIAVAAWPDRAPDIAVATVAAEGEAGAGESDAAPTSGVPPTEAPTTAPSTLLAENPDSEPELDDSWPFGEWPELDEAIVVCDDQLTVIPDPDSGDQKPPLPPFEELREALERCNEELRNALGEDFPAFELPPFDLDELDIPKLVPPELLPPELFDGQTPQLFDGEGFKFEFPEGEGFLFTPDGDGFHFELEPIDPEELERWFDEIEPRLDEWLGELEPEIDKWFEEFEPELEKQFEEFEPEIDKWFEEFEPEIDKWFEEFEPEFDEWFKEMDPELEKWLDEFGLRFEEWYEDWPGLLEEPASTSA